jgi:hypothetical protein
MLVSRGGREWIPDCAAGAAERASADAAPLITTGRSPGDGHDWTLLLGPDSSPP